MNLIEIFEKVKTTKALLALVKSGVIPTSETIISKRLELYPIDDDIFSPSNWLTGPGESASAENFRQYTNRIVDGIQLINDSISFLEIDSVNILGQSIESLEDLESRLKELEKPCLCLTYIAKRGRFLLDYTR